MSFLGGLISPGLTALSNGVSAYQGAQAKAADKEKADALQQIMMLRQQHQDEIRDALTQAQTNAANRPPRDPIADHDAIRKIDAANPIPSGAPPKEPSTIPGTPEWEDAEKKKVIIGAKFGYHPPEPLVATASDADPTQGVLTPRNQAAGRNVPSKSRAETAQNIAADARLKAAVSEMNNAHSGMDEFEHKLATKQTTINGMEQFVGSAGSSFTHDDPASRAIQSATLATLNKTNPELARYIRRALSFAEGESMISNRPSDFRTKMTAFLSQAASGASPEMIADIQSRRNSILGPLNQSVSHPAKAAPAGPSGNVDLRVPTSGLRAKYDAAVAHLKATGRAAEIPNLPVPPEEE